MTIIERPTVQEMAMLSALDYAANLFIGRLTAAIREGLTTRDIAGVTGIPETLVYKLVTFQTTGRT